MVPVTTFYCLLRKKRYHCSSWDHRCTHSAVHSSKIFKPFLGIILLCQGYCWIGKNTNKKLSCVMVFMMSEIPICFWCQWFSLSTLFLIKFWKFLVLYLGYGCMTFDFTTEIISCHLLLHANKWKGWVVRPPNIFQNVARYLKKGRLMSISSDS